MRDFIRKSDLTKIIPNAHEDNWISLDPDTEFLPADASGAVFSAEALRRLASSYNPYSSQTFANGQYEYNGYQQAWRYLGFMVDCDAVVSDDGDNHSGDVTGQGCGRYVLWAAYVDLEYQGGGIGEYQYWDRWTNSWDDTSCKFASKNNNNNNNKNGNNNGDGSEARCAKMDCHLENTHFTPLGFFKHKDYDEWMGQLFKHEGMCIWTDDEYSFMKNARKAWPGGCSATGSYYGDQPLYYDLKPAAQGDITVGLYTDERCSVEYVSRGSSDTNTVENIVGNIILQGGSRKSNDNGDDDKYTTFAQAQAAWDSAFDIFKICQPCIAYDLTNVGHNVDDDSLKGSGYYRYTDDGGRNNGGDDFDCYDDAGYTNVNQCMKFAAKTTMYAATYRDLTLAMQQSVLVDNPFVGGTETTTRLASLSSKSIKFARTFLAGLFFAVSSMICMSSLLWYRRVRRLNAVPRFPLKEPLVIT